MMNEQQPDESVVSEIFDNYSETQKELLAIETARPVTSFLFWLPLLLRVHFWEYW
jgi:hypothetical protein